MTETEMLFLADDDLGPEQRVSARLELERVRRVIPSPLHAIPITGA